MASYVSGGVRRGTANSRAASARSAESRRCPHCDRKSALKEYADVELGNGPQTMRVCRWCGYERWVDLPTGEVMEKKPDQQS